MFYPTSIQNHLQIDLQVNQQSYHNNNSESMISQQQIYHTIFEQLFHTIFGDNFFFLYFHWLKTMERKRKRENKRIM